MLPFSDLFAAFRWWAILMILGTAVVPLAYTIMGRLPDRGYAFSKMLGVLLVSYIFWILGSLGFLNNSLGGILFALALIIALSAWTYHRSMQAAAVNPQIPLTQWLRENWRYVLLTEVVFGLVFVLWIWVRAQNPAIEHTEKPMEFAFFNAVSRSPAFPPLDPWLAGYGISYYYFGYVMSSVIARLAAVPEPVAFNLVIAWLTAGTAVGAFGLVYNLITAANPAAADDGEAKAAEDELLPRRQRRTAQLYEKMQRHAMLFGLIAALALPLAGNMQILMEILHANRIGSTEFWSWLDVRDINQEPPEIGRTPRYQTSQWWWWRSSRVINEYHLSGRNEEGLAPIAEFPAFSLVLGDMHPHVLALPFAFLSLAMAFTWTQGFSLPRLSTEQGFSAQLLAGSTEHLKLFLLTAVVLGGLSFLNTWDVLIHLFIVLGAFTLGQWRLNGQLDNRIWGEVLTVGTALVVVAGLLYLPFYLGFRSQASAPFILPMLMRPTRLPQFLIIFAMPLWSILFLLGTLAIRQRLRHWQTGLTTAVALIVGLTFLTFFMGWIIASSQEGAGRVINLAHELNLSLPALQSDGSLFSQLRWGLTAVTLLAPTLLVTRLQFAGVTLLLAALIGLSAMAIKERVEDGVTQRHGDVETELPPRAPASLLTPLPFILLLIITGALLTLGPEFVYLKDNFGMRINTVFKFYYQAWVMFGIAALFGLSYLLRQVKVSGLIATAGYSLMLMVALLFPVYAVSSRAAEYRGPATAETRRPLTLDGLAHVENNNPDEYNALMWLRENVAGTPIILEAVGGAYSNYGRVSASTGLPTLLGWPGHQYQWRGSTPEPAQREPAVQTIYSQPDWANVAPYLNHYQVQYIYVGPLERHTYGPEGLDKFDGFLPVAYQDGNVTIYQWQP